MTMTMAKAMKFLSAAAVFAVTADSAQLAVRGSTSLEKDYEAYLKEHGRDGDEMSATMYRTRLKLFAKSIEKMKSHNARTDVSWKEGVNLFSDRTEEEKKEYLGYKRSGDFGQDQDIALADVGQTMNETEILEGAPHTVDFSNLKTASKHYIVDQGSCGSCWAVAAVSALEMRAEVKYNIKIPKLSYGQVRDCTPNPRHCGGTGGCQGATAELGYDYMKKGITTDKAYRSTAVQEDCPSKRPASLIKVSGYRTLPVNKLAPLVRAMNDGPVALSIDASGLQSYSSGVFHGCSQDAIISHAVVGVGYGKDSTSGKKYWLIRNSWGQSWGENGFFRVQKHDHDTGDKGHCGIDRKPKVGVGCDGGPPTLPVCGMCGILSDSSIPTGIKLLEKEDEESGEEEEEEEE
eukprot:TRINITY_DN923_c0_g1_i1.p1 TRINITY_DN923_c0_g1~~TRINITY_DN923_c0_g1_i1.p1  ORF type:complete len:404 (+),score=82.27 TRINITY_DN923_c0_g1_i1:62-1273(+)